VVHILIWHPKLLLHLVHGEGFPQPLSWIPHSSQLVGPLCLIHGGMTRTSPTSQQYGYSRSRAKHLQPGQINKPTIYG
jgi:hypothetical protein